MGERFHDFGEAYCGRQVACELIERSEHAACVDAEVEASCFEPRDCSSRDYYLHEDMWDRCLDALPSYSCESVAQHLVPATCVNVWRPVGHRR